MKKNRTVIILILTIALGLIIATKLFVWDRIVAFRQQQEALDMMHSIGAGINLGNDLDVHGVTKYIDNPTIEEYETFWKNPAVTESFFKACYDVGFKSVRIPVSWGDHLDEKGVVDPEFMARVKEVTDMALETGLIVILDTHHETSIIPTHEHEDECVEYVSNLWKQIADEFAEYDRRLLFEGLNEPRLRDSEYEWTEGTEELRDVVNKMNMAFVETVRSTGGMNEDRFLLIGGYATSWKYWALADIEVPEDDHYVMVAVHGYLPHKFTEADNGKEVWKESEESYTQDIVDLGKHIDELFLEKRIPVVITEFGCEEKQDEEQRVAWAKFYVNEFASRGVPCMWWDNGDEYEIIDRASGRVTKPNLVSTLIGFYLE